MGLAATLSFLSRSLPQGPAGTPGPEGRQGEKGAKVTPLPRPLQMLPMPTSSVLSPLPVFLGPSLSALHLLRLLLYLGGQVLSVCFRGTLVLWGPRGRQALWVLQAQQESPAPMAFGGSLAQW